jgi:hypothetical protein
MVNLDLFDDKKDETYTFENKDISVKPNFDCFNIWEISVDKDGQEVL